MWCDDAEVIVSLSGGDASSCSNDDHDDDDGVRDDDVPGSDTDTDDDAGDGGLWHELRPLHHHRISLRLGAQDIVGRHDGRTVFRLPFHCLVLHAVCRDPAVFVSEVGDESLYVQLEDESPFSSRFVDIWFVPSSPNTRADDMFAELCDAIAACPPPPDQFADA